MDVRRRLYRTHFVPQEGAVDVVRWVHDQGYRTALVSMCAPDAPQLWRASPFAGLIDVEVFSSEVGLRKPDPEIYRYASDALGVEPTRCLYVGDGSYGELRGAAAVGMHPVLLRDPGEVEGSMLRPGLEPWEGPTIASIADIRGLLEPST
jgi:putative hydrolase of the HAD superfamily